MENTLLLVSALHRAGVPCEAHLFEKGCHGTSLSTAEVNHPSAHRSRWLTLARECWMTPLISIWARGRRAVKRRRFFACLQKFTNIPLTCTAQNRILVSGNKQEEGTTNGYG